MLVIDIHFLARRYAAASHYDRQEAEWPPHPARLFSALVAAHHESSGGNPEERQALLWLEAQSPPVIGNHAKPEVVGRRRVLPNFVPVNDTTTMSALHAAASETDRTDASPLSSRPAKKGKPTKAEAKLQRLLDDQQTPDQDPPASALTSALNLLPERRPRQERHFPVVFPTRNHLSFGWNSEPTPPLLEALDRLCSRVTRLGHSSSLVSCRAELRSLQPDWVPMENGPHSLRVVTAGQLVRLERYHQVHQGVRGRQLPFVSQNYGPPAPQEIRSIVGQTVFSPTDWILFEQVGNFRPLASLTRDITRALRASLIEVHGEETLPESLSGHQHSSLPAADPHVAFVTLPHVGSQHADGSVQGCAIILPRTLGADARHQLLACVAKWERERSDHGVLTVGWSGRRFTLEWTDNPTRVSTDPQRWSRKSRRFVTATPIALDRNPGDLRSNRGGAAAKATLEAQETIAVACTRIGLPRPRRVEISLAPLLRGTQPASHYGANRHRPGRLERAKVHAEIEFDQQVEGPVILGAGRFFGLGLCLPITREGQ